GSNAYGCTLSFSRNSRHLAFPTGTSEVALIDTSDWRERQRIKADTTQVYTVVFSPDGRRLATSGSERIIRVWETETGKLLHSLQGHSRKPTSLGWSPDGGTLVSNGFGGEVILWNPVNGQAIRTLRENDKSTNEVVNTVAFSPDGRALAVTLPNNSVEIWGR
ncbi:MAG TPA: hypothetical protein VI643_06715, partial [Planctomycetota bacterium]|nr:hypothetical protein [Planctomycetota bacterium]